MVSNQSSFYCLLYTSVGRQPRLGLLLLLLLLHSGGRGRCECPITMAVVVLLLQDSPTEMTNAAPHLYGEQSNQLLLGTLMQDPIALVTSIMVARTSSMVVVGHDCCAVWSPILVLVCQKLVWVLICLSL